MTAYTVIEAPTNLGVGPTGVEELPTALKAAGLMTSVGMKWAERIMVPAYHREKDAATGISNPDGVREFALHLADAVERVWSAGEFPVVLGGDCSLEIGTALAMRRRADRGQRYGLFFLDGHADFYQPEAEQNGEVSSMELAFITGRNPEILSNIEGLSPYLRDEDVAVFGHRDAPQATKDGSQNIAQAAPAMHLFDIGRVRELGLEAATQQALDALTRPELAGFWIHCDVDVLADDLMPTVDYHLPDGGLTFDELSLVLSQAMGTGKAVGLSITIFNPRLDHDGTIAQRLTHSLVSGLRA